MFEIVTLGVTVKEAPYEWALEEPWWRICKWFMDKGALIESFEQGPHALYEEFARVFNEHVVGVEDIQYIKDAYVFYIGQPNIKNVRDWLRGFIKGTKKSMDKIYFVEVK